MKLIISSTFENWLLNLRDPLGKKLILARLSRIKNCIEGDFKQLKGLDLAIFEYRIHCHAGYRLYAYKRGQEVIIMLCAGSKSSQTKDILNAEKIAKEYLNGGNI